VPVPMSWVAQATRNRAVVAQIGRSPRREKRPAQPGTRSPYPSRASGPALRHRNQRLGVRLDQPNFFRAPACSNREDGRDEKGMPFDSSSFGSLRMRNWTGSILS